MYLIVLVGLSCACRGGAGGRCRQPVESGGRCGSGSCRNANGGNVASIIQSAHRYGVGTLIVKSSDGNSPWTQFSSTLAAELHAGGLRVCAWQYVYGNHPVTEAYLGAAAVHDGADCLIIDAESEYEGKYVSAQTYITRLRALIGYAYPLALAGFPYVDYHPGVPLLGVPGSGRRPVQRAPDVLA